MVGTRAKTVIGGAMIAIGLFQVSLGVTGGDAVYTAIAAVYALVGVAYLWFEVYTAE